MITAMDGITATIWASQAISPASPAHSRRNRRPWCCTLWIQKSSDRLTRRWPARGWPDRPDAFTLTTSAAA